MGGTRFIVAGSLIDGSGAEVRRNVYLAVKDTIITAIGSVADLPGNDGAAVDDFSHCTIVPALVDCSVSLSRSPAVDRRGGYLLQRPAKRKTSNGGAAYSRLPCTRSAGSGRQ
jgi:imidazolonepropionase-like amidohydrolase